VENLPCTGGLPDDVDRPEAWRTLASDGSISNSLFPPDLRLADTREPSPVW
jgi:hypothetical protein